jgi:hypothetical protein
MSAQLFFYNITNVPFLLYDLDGHLHGTIGAAQNASFRLNYSSTFLKQYNLVVSGTNQTVSFWLSVSGELVAVNSGVAILQIGTETRCQFNTLNKLTIFTGGTLPPAPPQLYPPVPPAVLYYNDY